MTTTSASIRELTGRATDLLPRLRERAEEAERLRQVPPESVKDIVSAGLMQAVVPERYGGMGLPFNALFEIGMELSRACTSTGWCFAVWSIHNWAMGLFPQQAQDEYYTSPDIISSSSYAPNRAKLEPADGGFTLNGVWDFSSGCDYAEWETLGVPHPQGMGWAMVPKGDFRIVDTWYVSGLKGSGSKDVVVENAFVPPHRIAAVPALGLDGVGYGVHGKSAYRLPAFAYLPYTIASPLIGAAQGMIDEFTSHVNGSAKAGSVALQMRLGEAAAEVDGARAILRSDCAEMLANAEAGGVPSMADMARYRRNQAFVGRLALQAANRLFDASGGYSLYDSDPMQRFHRDANAISHHLALHWDSGMEAFGRSVFGLPPKFF